MTIQLNGISKSYGTRSLFDELTLQIGAKSRIGLIGRNGCGKSTLLKMIMGQLELDAGSIYRAPGLRVNYLSQEPRITPHLTLEAEMRSVFTELNRLAEEEGELLHQLEIAGQTEEQHIALARRLDFVHREMDRLDARSVDARIGRILKGLGFSLADHQRKTGEFSGGWQMRINLAKVLLEGADILLLDEPTNHLDLEACEWLESFLKEYPGGLVIVSHDRRFLDQVCTEIAELENGSLRAWTGNYSAHLTQKAAELEQLTSAYERQQKDLAKQTAFVERFRASATRSTQAKSREKQLEKIERIELPDHDQRRMAFRFPSPQPSGRQVMTLRNVSKSFGDKTLFTKLDADLQRNQRIFLLGANGAGKTTLLRLILGLETLDGGEIRPGHNTLTGYFSQNQLDTLEPNLSIFDTLQQACPDLTNTELRTLLGRFLFTGEQVFKPVLVLSGGEKSKLALAKLMMSGPNTLLLDEPTNHMDIPAKEVMSEALLAYEGSMLCISHDRYFIQELATDIWELYNGHLLTYCGDYDYYVSSRDMMRNKVDRIQKPVDAQTVAASTSAAPKNNTFMARKEMEKQFKKVEKNILTLENEIAVLETQLHDPSLQQDYQQLQALSGEIGQKQKQLAELNEQWAELAEGLS
ncbi:MAG TPA: ABC-F family ATP-binding cassette domain-containing protein [Coleofasciculaceae cyanobacterium]|jgi:ATP-binding cassette subfamily F protein 3